MENWTPKQGEKVLGLWDSGTDHIIYPDNGARGRYKLPHTHTLFEKKRDSNTGVITGTISKDDAYKGKDCWIVDDICDGGRTFIEIAKLIRNDVKSLHLAVSHGIFSKGLEELNQWFDSIWTTDSFKLTEGVNTIPFQEIVNDYFKR